jgi:CBS domain-containing membrane protein
MNIKTVNASLLTKASHVVKPLQLSAAAAMCAGLSIGVIALTTRQLMPAGGPAVIASMGAAAVIVFQFPESPAARPWAILGGHLVSALIGVTVSQVIPDRTLAAGIAVGLSLWAMSVFRCMHPPGGGTALVAVLGGAVIQDAGYRFVLFPTFINALLLAVFASVFVRLTAKPLGDNLVR